MRAIIFLLVSAAALATLAIQAGAQGQRCWRVPGGWVCQQQQQTNPSDGR